MSHDSISEILRDAPDNCNTWGSNDEFGAINYLTPERILSAIDSVNNGKSFTLGLKIVGPDGAPLAPGRARPEHYMTMDKGHIESGKIVSKYNDDWESSDDVIHMPTHGTTHVDALGHVWYDDRLYNGFDPNSTKGGLDRCGVENLGKKGIIGKGVLIDLARNRGVDYLKQGERVTLDEIKSCADSQGVNLKQADVLLLRLGVIELYYKSGRDSFYEEYICSSGETMTLKEPGLTYTQEVAEWLDDLEIALYGTDSISAELSDPDGINTLGPLHPVLLRDLGIVISELNWLQDLAADCAEDGNYEFLYMASPLKICGGTGSPVNPVVIK